MKITARNRQILALLRAQRGRLSTIREDALRLLDAHRADKNRPCAKGTCQGEIRLKNFVQAVDIKVRFLDAEIARYEGKLWPWSTISHGMWLTLISDAQLETAVVALGEPIDPLPALAVN